MIFDTDNLVPVWSPDMEYSDDFFGTYEFYLNIFRDRCGIYINDRKEVCLNINLGMGVTPMECTDPSGECAAHGTLNSNQSNRVDGSHDDFKIDLFANREEQPVRKSKYVVGGGVASSDPAPPPPPIETPPPIVEAGPVLGVGEAIAEAVGLGDVESDPTVEALEAVATTRDKALSKDHCMDHYPPNPFCPGCNAKAKNKYRSRGAFDRTRKDMSKP